MKKFLIIALKALCGILICLAIIGCFMMLVPLREKNLSMESDESITDSRNWMAGLDDSLKLNQITMPGSHDAGTKYVQLSYFARCQSIEPYVQLEEGVRYLDIRLGITAENHLKLMHGFTSCLASWKPFAPAFELDLLLDQCYSFLEKNPSETIVFVVKQEYGKEPVSQFQKILDSYIQKNPARWYTGSSIPSLGQARGKLVLFRRYEDKAVLKEKAGIELLWENQPGSKDVSLSYAIEQNENCTVYVQDRYEYNLEDKWIAFMNTNSEFPSFASENNVLLNFLSTKGPAQYGHPYRFASTLNKKLLSNMNDEFKGWIIMDFCNKDMSYKIYKTNFQQ